MVKKHDTKRNKTDARKEYNTQYKFNWRRKYRKYSYSHRRESLGSGSGGCHPNIIFVDGEPDFSREREWVDNQKKYHLGKPKQSVDCIN